MNIIQDILALCETFMVSTKTPRTVLSAKVFGASQKIDEIREGAGITSRKIDEAFEWFDRHWPADVDWPAAIPRPSQQTKPSRSA